MLIMLPLLLSFSCDSGWQSRLLFLLLLRLVSSSVPCEGGKRWPKTISSFCTRALRKAEKNTFPLLLLLLRAPQKENEQRRLRSLCLCPITPSARPHRSTTTRLLTPGVTHSAGKVGGNGRFSLLVVVVRSRKKRGKGRQCPEGRVTARSGYRFEREAVCQES